MTFLPFAPLKLTQYKHSIRTWTQILVEGLDSNLIPSLSTMNELKMKIVFFYEDDIFTHCFDKLTPEVLLVFNAA
jgi:hypothetical protein